VIGPLDRTAMDCLWGERATLREVANATGRRSHDVQETLTRLLRRGLVRRSGSPFVYALSLRGIAMMSGHPEPIAAVDLRRVAEADEALIAGAEPPWDTAYRLGYPSADSMVDAVLAYRRNNSARVVEEVREGRDVPRGRVGGGTSRRASSAALTDSAVVAGGAAPVRGRGSPRGGATHDRPSASSAARNPTDRSRQ
jgi:hypothetical protein